MNSTVKSQRWRRLVAALIVGLATILAGQTAGWAQESAAADLIQQKTLSNGLDVIVIPDPSLPIVTVEVAVKNGAFTEPPDFNGLSHLYEHMFFKGNAVIPNQEAYLERMRELGIVFNGTTSTERVNYFFTLPSDNLEPGLKFMYDAITSPKFDTEEFAKEQKVVTGEIDRNESSPYYWFGQEMEKRLWYEHPSRKDPLGDRETVLASTVDMMRQMQKRYYVPNNSALLIAGDVEPEAAFAQAEKIFKKWKKGPDPHAKWPVPEHPPLEDTSAFVVERDVKVPYVQMSWHGPSVDEDPGATYAADVLSYILSQPTSKFQKALVESGLTLNAGLGYYTQRYTGPINLTAQVEADNLKPAIKGLLAELKKLENPDYFTDEQLESAKTILAVQDLYSREKTSAFAHTVSFWWAVAGPEYYIDYIPNLKKVTRQDIADYVSTYISGKPFVAGVLLSPDVREQLGLSEEALMGIIEEAQAEVAQEKADVEKPQAVEVTHES